MIDQGLKTENPYPEFLEDEASGVKVIDERRSIWEAGYKAGIQDERDSHDTE